MKKWFLGILLFVPLFNFAALKDLPEGYYYIGFQPDREKINDLIKETVSADVYPAVMNRISNWLTHEIGFDFFNEPIELLGLDPQQYVEFYFKPGMQDEKAAILALHSPKPQKVVESIKAVLRKKWTAVHEENLDKSVKRLYTKNPKYARVPLYYLILTEKVVFANSIRILEKLNQAGQHKDMLFLEHVQQAVKTEKPLMACYFGEQITTELSQGQVNYGIALLLAKKNKELQLDLLTGKKFAALNYQMPNFIDDNPLLLLSIPVDRNALVAMAEKSKDPQVKLLLSMLNLKESLGQGFFVTLNDFNFQEIFAGNLINTSAVLGFELTDKKPYLSLLDTMALGGSLGEDGAAAETNKAVKSFYQGQSLYSLKGLASENLKELHIAVMDQYLLVTLNLDYLKKTVQASLQNKKKGLLPVDQKNLVLYMNFSELFKKIPLLAMLQQKGIAVDNLKTIISRLNTIQSADFFRLSLSIIFNR